MFPKYKLDNKGAETYAIVYIWLFYKLTFESDGKFFYFNEIAVIRLSFAFKVFKWGKSISGKTLIWLKLMYKCCNLIVYFKNMVISSI